MQELIKIQNKGGKETVNARELYEFLGFDSGNWTRWAKQNIEENPFAQENDDFRGFLTMRNGNETKDFALTIDFAKRLAMMAKTEKGEQARKYFIECEKRLKSFQLPQTFSEALLLASQQAAKIEQQQKLIEEQRPKVEFFDAVSGSDDAIDIGTAAKVLKLGIGRNTLFEFLRNEKILMDNNIPYQKFVDLGHFRVIEQKYNKPDGSISINIKCLVYQKGLNFIRKRYLEQNTADNINSNLLGN